MIQGLGAWGLGLGAWAGLGPLRSRSAGDIYESHIWEIPIIEAAARKGSAELLILSALEDGQLHGYDIAREISRRSGGLLTFHVASLYPLLYKLEDRAWIAGAGSRRPANAAGAITVSPPRAGSARETARTLGSVRRRADQGRRVETCMTRATEGTDDFRSTRACANGWRPRASSLPRTRRRSTRSPNTSTICIARRSRRQIAASRPTRWSKPSWRAWVRSRWPSPIARSGARAAIRRPRTGAPVSPRMSVTPLAGDAPRSRILGGGGPDARHRHRRVHGGVQHHQRAALGIAALPESRAARAGVGERQGQSRADLHRRASQLRRLETRSEELFVDGHLGVPDLQRGVGRRARTGAGHSRHRRACSRCSACRRRWAASSPRRKRRRDTGSW